MLGRREVAHEGRGVALNRCAEDSLRVVIAMLMFRLIMLAVMLAVIADQSHLRAPSMPGPIAA